MDTKTMPAYTPSEMMAYRASLELTNTDVVFVGIGLPNLACNLARALHAPDLFMIYESGAVGTIPERLPISIGDPCLVTDSLSIVSQGEIFQSYLQAGRIEVGFLGGAQIDRYGNINTTVIGKDYHSPKVRLPGSGGACEIASHSRRLLIVMRLSPKSFVEKCDYITSPGHFYPHPQRGKISRKEMGLPGLGPQVVITDQGVIDFEDGEMRIVELYPGSSVESMQAACGFKLRVAPSLKQAGAPPEQAVELLRKKLDPERLYL